MVGIVANPLGLGEQFVLVDPQGAPPPQVAVVLVGDPHDTRPVAAASAQIGPLIGRSDDAPQRAVLVVVVIAVAMAMVGLIAAAGFVVLAHRRQRQLGLLAAIGATRQHLRLVMIASGALIGLTAAVAGTVLGVIGWQFVRPAMETAADRHLGRLELPWPIVALTVALVVLVATAAAWWPARGAARVPVMAALSGRPPAPRPVRRPLALAAALVAAGVVAILGSGVTQRPPNEVLLVGGMLAVIAGAVIAAPGAIRAVGLSARRLPLSGRIAVRDLARFHARAAAALAAITLGLGITVGVVVVAGAARAADRRDVNLPPNALLVRGAGSRDGPPVVVLHGDPAALDGRAATVAAALGTRVTTLALDVAVDPAGGAGAEAVVAGDRIDAHTIEDVGPAYVATPAVLAHVGIDPASVDPATDVLTSDAAVDVLLDTSSREDAPARIEQRDELPRWSSGARTLVTEAAVARRGWQVVRAAWLIEVDRPLTAAQLGAARAAAAAAGLVVESQQTGSDFDQIQTWATVIGVALALGIILMAVGLIRADAAGDLRTLAANGAAGRTRRNIAAVTAATLGLLGAVLGATGAYATTLAVYHHDLARLTPVPWRSLLALAVGLPLLGAGFAWVTAGREPAAIARRTLD